jgi:hypothetical protein
LPTSRQLFRRTKPEPSGGAEPFILAAELLRTVQLMRGRIEELEGQLVKSEAKRLEAERVAEHALKLANGVISAIKTVSKPAQRPPRKAAEETLFTRCTVDGVSVMQCALCAFTCGTLSALNRHRANAHALQHCDGECAAACSPSRRQNALARSPPRAPSSGLGRADMSFLDQIRAVADTPYPDPAGAASAAVNELRTHIGSACATSPPDRLPNVNALVHTLRSRQARQRA